MIKKKYDNLVKDPILLRDLGLQFATQKSKYKRRYGLYKCDCGNEFKTIISNVKYGTVRSCGCLVKKSNRVVMSNNFKTHGLSKHRLYQTWVGMMSRCYNPKNINYSYYGDRNITVCKRWANVENFIKDMDETYEKGLSLDRIDNDKGYNFENCRWADATTQIHNQRTLIITNTSGYVGIWYRKDRKKYAAELKVNKKKVSLGLYIDKETAMIIRELYIIDNNLPNKRNMKNATKSELKKILAN